MKIAEKSRGRTSKITHISVVVVIHILAFNGPIVASLVPYQTA